MVQNGVTLPYVQRQTRQPQPAPPPEVVPIHAMPPAMRQAVMNQQQQQQQQQQQMGPRQIPGQNQPFTVRGPISTHQGGMDALLKQYGQTPVQTPGARLNFQPNLQVQPVQQQAPQMPFQALANAGGGAVNFQSAPTQQQIPQSHQPQVIQAPQQPAQTPFHQPAQTPFQATAPTQVTGAGGGAVNFQPNLQVQQIPRAHQPQVLQAPQQPTQTPFQAAAPAQVTGAGGGAVNFQQGLQPQTQFYQPQAAPVFSNSEISTATTAPPAEPVHQAPVVTTSPAADDLAIGIDLGTTYSVVGVFKDGRVEIITNEHGSRTTPSCVAFTESGERLVGEAAKSQAASNPTRTIFDAKRLIGRKFSDEQVQDDMKHWPFEVVGDEKTGTPQIRIKHAGGEQVRDYAPEEISAMVLQKLKQTAERHLGKTVSRAVITCPAYFNDSQRQATIDAAKIAGLEVLRIINEPTAASIAYGLNTGTEEKNILVFDLGGGTMDVSLLHLFQGVFTVKATGGNCHLGGCDFDNNLLKFALDSATQGDHAPEQEDAPKISEKAMRRLLTACERAKRTLSGAPATTIEVDAFHGNGDDLSVSVTRAQFEMLNTHLFDACLETVRDVLRDAGVDRSQVHDVVFVGGSSRIPRIQELVTAYFQGKQPNVSINPDECVGYGAAIQASILAGHHGNFGDKVLLVDVAPLSLGVETAGGAMSVLIPRNTTIPCLKTNMFSTYRDNQESVLVSIFEGERALCADNNLLGNFYLNDIQPVKAGVPKIQVTFEMDVNGVLHVSAEDQATSQQNFISIESETGRLSKERIEELVAEAARHQESDQKKMEQIEARNGFERFLFQLKQTLISDEVVEKVSAEDRKQIETMVNQQLQWVTGDGAATKEQCDAQKQKIEEALAPLLGKLYATTGELPGQEDAKLTTTLDGIEKGASEPAGAAPQVEAPTLKSMGPPYDDAKKPEGALVIGPPPPAQTRTINL